MPHRERVSVGRTVQRFALTVVALLLVMAAASVVLAQKIAREETVDAATHQAGHLAQALGGRYFDTDPEHPEAAARMRRFDRLVRDRIADGSVLRVKVWAPDGTVLYSDEPRQVGRRFTLEPRRQALFESGGADADLTGLEADENLLDRALDHQVDAVVEVYAAFESADGDPLLFEVYVPAQDLLEHERELMGHLMPLMVAGPMILALALAPFVHRLVSTLRAADGQRMRWVSEMLRARTEERRMVAQAIHGQVLPDLAVALLSLDDQVTGASRDRPVDADALGRAAASVRTGAHHLRELLTDLRAPAVSRLGLAEALRQRGQSFARTAVDVLVEEQPTDLTDEESQLIHDLAQEGLLNASRHGQAHQVRVRARRTDTHLVVEVHDDGTGLAGHPDLSSDHGLGLLADSLADIGGDLDLRSGAEHGAVLTMRVPRASPAPPRADGIRNRRSRGRSSPRRS